MARFLVDEDLPRSLAPALRSVGHDVVDARDIGLRNRPDVEVAQRAVSDHRVLLSGDLAFGDLRRHPPGSHPGIVVVRLSMELPATARVLASLADRELEGALVVVREHGLRIRR